MSWCWYRFIKNFRPEVPFNHIGHLGPIRVVRSCILLQSVPIARFLKPYLVEDQLHLPLYLKAIQNFQVRLHRKYYRYFQFIMISFIKKLFSLPLPGSKLGSPSSVHGSVIYRCHYLSMCMYQLSRDLKNSIETIHPVGKAWCTPFPVLLNVCISWSLV